MFETKKYGSLEDIRKKVKIKEDLIDKQELGRSLASNPYQPRPLDIASKDSKLSKIFYINKTSDTFIVESMYERLEDSSYKSLAMDVIDYNHGADLDDIFVARRYTEKTIIRKDPIVDEYQLVESACFGVDAIVIYADSLDDDKEKLKNLIALSYSLQLTPIFATLKKDGLKEAIKMYIDYFYFPFDDEEKLKDIVSVLPNSKVIIANKFVTGVDAIFESIDV